MPRRRHTAEQMIRKLQEGEGDLAAGVSLAQVCQRLEISEKTFYRWRSQYGGMQSGEMRRLRALESENRRLKKLVADLSLDKAILKEALEGNY